MLTLVFVMAQNVLDKRIDCLFVAEDFFHRAKLALAFFDGFLGGVLCERAVFGIDPGENLFVQIELDDAAFVIDGARRAVLHCLRHVVNVDVVAEDFDRAAVLARNRRSRKADVARVREAVADNPGSPDRKTVESVSLLVTQNFGLFGKPVMPPVRLVRHDDDVPPFAQRAVAFLEFLHRRKDDAVGFPAFEERFQVRAAFRLNGRLPQEILAPRELSVKLIVQIVPVRNDDDGRAFECRLEQVRVEHHGK